MIKHMFMVAGAVAVSAILGSIAPYAWELISFFAILFILVYSAYHIGWYVWAVRLSREKLLVKHVVFSGQNDDHIYAMFTIVNNQVVWLLPRLEKARKACSAIGVKPDKLLEGKRFFQIVYGQDVTCLNILSKYKLVKQELLQH